MTPTAVKGCTVLKFHSTSLVSATVAIAVLSAAWAGVAAAEPAQDSAAHISDLSRQTEQLTESIRTAQQELDRKLQLVSEADKKYADDLAALDAAGAQLAARQGAVDNVAAAAYMGGRTDGLNAILTAASPMNLIDKLAIHRLVGTEMAEQLKSFRRVNAEAHALAASSAQSAAAAKAAVDEAVAVRADLQAKQAELRSQVTAVLVRNATLPPAQQAAQAVPSEVVAALGLAPPVPTVGMGGLVPNARALAAYIMATYPGVSSIGGVRADPLPDHPSGRAIDIMIGGNMALGDVINADVQAQAARFGVSYTMWRVAAHYDHVHITVH
jgi:hypothetical protein